MTFYLNDFIIDNSDLIGSSPSTREFNVIGNVGAKFMLQVFNSSQQFYNFNTRSFSTGFTSENNLSVEMKGETYINSIVFPANGSGDTYTILILTGSNKDTEIEFSVGKNSYSTTISQVADTQLTFTIATANTNNYTTWSSSNNITSTGSPTLSSNVVKTLDWTLNNNPADVGAFGLRLTRQPVDTDWYYTTTETVDGAISSGTQVVVDDLTDLATGMYITAVSSGSLSGTPTITAINTSSKTLTISSAQTFADGITLTFQARGSSVIKKSIGANIDFSNFTTLNTSAVAAELSKTVRTTATDTVILLNGTYGISGGGFVTISGRGIVNTSTNTVQTVDVGETGGGVTMQVEQEVKAGTKIYFVGSTLSIDVDNAFTIKSHPTANKTIYLNLDNFITPGTSS